ncbi:putative sigma factor binding protein [Helianthus annuus]|nr:putative sigma factor binding protein [Helianthus annuus]
MDMLAVKPTKNCRTKKHTNNNNNLKVVYISSPMKVKTSASRFRSLVQELTGRDSDITRYNAGYFDDPVAPTTTSTSTQGGSSSSLDAQRVDSKTVEFTQQAMFDSSESLLDDVFSSEMFDQLDGILPSYSLYQS